MARPRRDVLTQIRDAVLDGRYVVTPHAWAEMRNDRLVLADIESALLRGRIDREYRDDPRGTRYRVVGTASDLETPVVVVVRFILDDRLLVITTFVLGNDNR